MSTGFGHGLTDALQNAASLHPPLASCLPWLDETGDISGKLFELARLERNITLDKPAIRARPLVEINRNGDVPQAVARTGQAKPALVGRPLFGAFPSAPVVGQIMKERVERSVEIAQPDAGLGMNAGECEHGVNRPKLAVSGSGRRTVVDVRQGERRPVEAEPDLACILVASQRRPSLSRDRRHH